jgi:hypothetical protein
MRVGINCRETYLDPRQVILKLHNEEIGVYLFVRLIVLMARVERVARIRNKIPLAKRGGNRQRRRRRHGYEVYY